MDVYLGYLKCSVYWFDLWEILIRYAVKKKIRKTERFDVGKNRMMNEVQDFALFFISRHIPKIKVHIIPIRSLFFTARRYSKLFVVQKCVLRGYGSA